MNITKELAEQWRQEFDASTEENYPLFIAQRAAAHGAAQREAELMAVGMEPVSVHKGEVTYTATQLAAARLQGAEEERAIRKREIDKAFALGKENGEQINQGLSNEVMELLTLALEAVKLLGHIRCHPKRHDLERSWLSEADRVIGYWEKERTHQRISAAIAAAEKDMK